MSQAVPTVLANATVPTGKVAKALLAEPAEDFASLLAGQVKPTEIIAEDRISASISVDQDAATAVIDGDGAEHEPKPDDSQEKSENAGRSDSGNQLSNLATGRMESETGTGGDAEIVRGKSAETTQLPSQKFTPEAVTTDRKLQGGDPGDTPAIVNTATKPENPVMPPTRGNLNQTGMPQSGQETAIAATQTPALPGPTRLRGPEQNSTATAAIAAALKKGHEPATAQLKIKTDQFASLKPELPVQSKAIERGLERKLTHSSANVAVNQTTVPAPMSPPILTAAMPLQFLGKTFEQFEGNIPQSLENAGAGIGSIGSTSPNALVTTTFSTTPTYATPDTAKVAAHQMLVAVAQSAGGTTEIQLSPHELGRVKLVLSPQEAGIVISVLAERPETYDLMRRHVDILAQEFEQLGYRDLTFEFDQQSGDTNADHHDEDAGAFQSDTSAPLELTPAQQSILATSGLDLRL